MSGSAAQTTYLRIADLKFATLFTDWTMKAGYKKITSVGGVNMGLEDENMEMKCDLLIVAFLAQII